MSKKAKKPAWLSDYENCSGIFLSDLYFQPKKIKPKVKPSQQMRVESIQLFLFEEF